MPKVVKAYVRYIDSMNRAVGKFTMYMVLGMVGILLFETFSRTIFNHPWIWTVESAQFVMAAYYLIGGGCSLLIAGHVRMDILYERWSAKKKAIADVITASMLVFYIVVLLYGGISATQYALIYGQVNYTSWAPPLAPIKIIMTLGIAGMLLQVVSQFIKDLAIATGKAIT